MDNFISELMTLILGVVFFFILIIASDLPSFYQWLAVREHEKTERRRLRKKKLHEQAGNSLKAHGHDPAGKSEKARDSQAL